MKRGRVEQKRREEAMTIMKAINKTEVVKEGSARRKEREGKLERKMKNGKDVERKGRICKEAK